MLFNISIYLILLSGFNTRKKKNESNDIPIYKYLLIITPYGIPWSSKRNFWSCPEVISKKTYITVKNVNSIRNNIDTN